MFANNIGCTIKIWDVARIVYEANRAYNETFEPWKHRAWSELRDDERTNYIEGVKFWLDNPEVSEEIHHNVWIKERIMAGWKYDEKFDPFEKKHPYLKPFNQLRPDQQFKDYLFRGLINLFKTKFQFKIEE